jgi:hypothetical protein
VTPVRVRRRREEDEKRTRKPLLRIGKTPMNERDCSRNLKMAI